MTSAATGWFGGVGVKINVPMIGPGDYFSAQFNYTSGAAGYVVNNASSGAGIANPVTGGYYSNLTSNSFGFGILSDGVYGLGTAGTSSSIDLTTAWGVNAAYEHFWNKRWQTSVYGAYIASSYDSTANAQLCLMETSSTTTAGCGNNWNYFAVGTRTQFNVDSQTYIGLDVIYTSLQTANSGLAANSSVSGARPAETRTVGDQSAWMAEFRFHRNFYP